MRTPAILRKRDIRPVLSKEERTLRALETTFPSGEWVEPKTALGSSSPVAQERGDPTREELRVSNPVRPGPSSGAGEGSAPVEAPSLTIIGGTKYDEDALAYWLFQNDGYEIVTGAGRGVESALEGVTRIDLDPDVYGKSARKVNVEQVLSWDPTSPLLLVGSGERVKQAEAWLKRANWGREVHRIP